VRTRMGKEPILKNMAVQCRGIKERGEGASFDKEHVILRKTNPVSQTRQPSWRGRAIKGKEGGREDLIRKSLTGGRKRGGYSSKMVGLPGGEGSLSIAGGKG